MTAAPCKDCAERHLGCHSKCEKYEEYSSERSELRRQRMIDHEYTECHSRQAVEALWRKRKKEKRR